MNNKCELCGRTHFDSSRNRRENIEYIKNKYRELGKDETEVDDWNLCSSCASRQVTLINNADIKQAMMKKFPQYASLINAQEIIYKKYGKRY